MHNALTPIRRPPLKKAPQAEPRDWLGQFAGFWLGPVVIPGLLWALTGSPWLAGIVSLVFLLAGPP